MRYDAVVRTVDYVWKKHDALRATFRQGETGWEQYIPCASENFRLDRASLRDLPPSEREAAVRRIAIDAASTLDIHSSMVRFVVVENIGEQEGEKELLICVHHLVCDLQSISVLCSDIATVARQIMRDMQVATPKAYPYRDAAEIINSYASSPGLRVELDQWTKLPWQDLTPLPQADFGKTPTIVPRKLTATKSFNKTSKSRALPEAFSGSMAVLGMALTSYFGGPVATELVHNGRSLQQRNPHARHSRQDILQLRDWILPRTVINTVGWFALSGTVILPSANRAYRALLESSLHAMPNLGAGYGILRHIGAPEVFDEMLIAKGRTPGVWTNYTTMSAYHSEFRTPFEWKFVDGGIDCFFRGTPLTLRVQEHSDRRRVAVTWDVKLHGEDAGYQILDLIRRSTESQSC
ncbi:condensation domain-containing protein [Actinocrispum wychmicini]|uniref:Condensation domain-containing protein n=2 Tax=Actinocrispum wychmicini TaxID=1213861 RepID=A0A4R2JL64_9PSEU|nr:condensation domain-containing protein [Actinocrispum wychmicini]